NQIEDINVLGTALCAKQIKHLHVSGNRIEKFADVLKVLKNLVNLETVDFRSNPFTFLYYPKNSHMESIPSFLTLDTDFQKHLSDSVYVRRACYRASFITILSKNIKYLDGIRVSDHDRLKAKKILARVKNRVENTANKQNKKL
ncbi:hypothetical protein HK096_002386, partial [Nowakowskiella sp. JEL0078]